MTINQTVIMDYWGSSTPTVVCIHICVYNSGQPGSSGSCVVALVHMAGGGVGTIGSEDGSVDGVGGGGDCACTIRLL